jgi:hypothetical protein
MKNKDNVDFVRQRQIAHWYSYRNTDFIVSRSVPSTTSVGDGTTEGSQQDRPNK